MPARPEGVVDFYNRRGTAEQWIKEGTYALNWTRLSCHRFVANQVWLLLFILAYNPGNFLRRLGLPKAVRDWSLPSLPVKLTPVGGRLVRHARRLMFQLAEVAVPGRVFWGVLQPIGRLCAAAGPQLCFMPVGGMISNRGEAVGLARFDWSANAMKAILVVPSEVNPPRQRVVKRRGLGWLTWFLGDDTIITIKHRGFLRHPQSGMDISAERQVAIDAGGEQP